MLSRSKNEDNKNKQPSRKNTGFYIALAICIVSVAAAAWTTYGNVVEYKAGEEPESIVSELPAGNEVSNEPYGEGQELKQAEKADQRKSSDSSEKKGREKDEVSEAAVNAEVKGKSLEDPVEGGNVLKKFSPEDPLYSKTTSDWRTHAGVDISAGDGVSVHAVGKGTVSEVMKDDMLGNIVVIDHGSFTARYCGLTDTPVVRAGNNVSSGDTIGYVGVVPSEMLDESHVHIEYLQNGKPVAPEALTLSK